ncbi:MAG: Acyl-coenzyme A thioesterase PaaI, contains HGG motif [Verrucomicrobia bacterium]|jgi:thioesterase domain-containing protein|nr:MAG: Acyl-coenzyme A thioesterase PaaI, contains HGG motif [Verrucomicrobiota bacterium]
MREVILAETERFLHEQIPLTRAMGVSVRSWDGQELWLSAPLQPNHNHLGTAFGGSLSALATLAGYSLLWLLLEDREAHIVIRDSSMRYRHPVRGDLQARCAPPSRPEWDAFHARFAHTGKARLTLRVEIVEADQVCVEFEGTFVALR